MENNGWNGGKQTDNVLLIENVWKNFQSWGRQTLIMRNEMRSEKCWLERGHDFDLKLHSVLGIKIWKCPGNTWVMVCLKTLHPTTYLYLVKEFKLGHLECSLTIEIKWGVYDLMCGECVCCCPPPVYRLPWWPPPGCRTTASPPPPPPPRTPGQPEPTSPGWGGCKLKGLSTTNSFTSKNLFLRSSSWV